MPFDYEISVYSVLDGHPTIKYLDVALIHVRNTKNNYTRADRMRAGRWALVNLGDPRKSLFKK